MSSKSVVNSPDTSTLRLITRRPGGRTRRTKRDRAGPEACVSSHSCKVTFRAVGWRVRQRDCAYRGVNYPFGKVVSMHFLRVASVRVEEQPRKRPAGYVQEHARSGTSSSLGVFSHHHADQPYVTTRPTALTSRSGGPRRTKSDNRRCRRAARRARFYLRDDDLASGRRG